MAITNESLTDRQYQQLRQLFDLDEGLTEWEIKFLDSIAGQSYALTSRQIATLDKIHTEKAG